jgi:hypothetical protein
MDTHGYSEKCKVLKVIAEMKALCLSVEEAIAVWKDCREWEVKLLSVAATKDSRTVKSTATIMDTHGYSEECKVLKVYSSLLERELISQSDLEEQVQQSGLLFEIFVCQCMGSHKIVLESVEILKANEMTNEADVLSVSSKAYQLVRKSEHRKEDGRMRSKL